MKVLIVSHNCFSTYQNMGKTLKSLFSEFDKKELCQLYFYPTIPNIDVVNSYFRITDKDIIRSFKYKEKCGNIIQSKEIQRDNELLEHNSYKIYSSKIKKNIIIKLLRECLWTLGTWDSKQLHYWLEKEKPDVIFFASGNACFSFRIVKKLACQLQIPVVTYVCDDYLLNQKNGNYEIGHKYRKNIMSKSECIICICQKMCDDYKKIFQCKKLDYIMTGCSINDKKIVKKKDKDFLYIGNVSLGRWKTLCAIGEALNIINSERNLNYKLDIFTFETDSEIIAAFKNIKSISFHGEIKAEKIPAMYETSTFVLHVEDLFSVKMESRVKYSISTKIGELLDSNSCILAVGSKELASIE